MGAQVFEGIKVADFTWVGVGPITVKYLADHGATVVHVESATRLDALRVGGPFKDDVPGLDRSGFNADFNSSKYGLALNLDKPEAREVAKRLILWADVVAQSFTPRVMAAWGLAYKDIVEMKPDIVMLSTCLQGQTGPYREYAGFGGQGAALAGIHRLTGWPDRNPAGPYGAYTDFIAPRFAAAALVAALDYKQRTGKGQHIDMAQAEAGIQFLAPVVLDYTVNGRVAQSLGNRSGTSAPHGAFRCKGEDRWVAIAVETDGQWQALCTVMGEPEWTQDRRYATALERLKHQDELERSLEEWTKERDAYQLMEQLQAVGVPCGVVQKTSDLFSDPQLTHRGHFQMLEHREMGLCAYDAPSFRLSKTPGKLRMAAPCLGQHTEMVLKEFLGYSDNEIAGLVETGALE